MAEPSQRPNARFIARFIPTSIANSDADAKPGRVNFFKPGDNNSDNKPDSSAQD